MKLIPSLLVSACLALGATACGGSDGHSGSDPSEGSDPTERIVALFVSAGADETEARCVAEQLAADVSPDDIENYVQNVLQEADPASVENIDMDVAMAVGEAVNECGF